MESFGPAEPSPLLGESFQGVGSSGPVDAVGSGDGISDPGAGAEGSGELPAESQVRLVAGRRRGRIRKPQVDCQSG